jgi:hypothetical protein
MKQWAIYVDFVRPLAETERASIYEAVEATVPGGGCIGVWPRAVNDELYITVDADTDDEARARAEAHVVAVLEKARVAVGYDVRASPRGQGARSGETREE